MHTTNKGTSGSVGELGGWAASSLKKKIRRGGPHVAPAVSERTCRKRNRSSHPSSSSSDALVGRPMMVLTAHHHAATAAPYAAMNTTHHQGGAATSSSPHRHVMAARVAPITATTASIGVKACPTDTCPRCVTRRAPDALQRGHSVDRKLLTMPSTGNAVTNHGYECANWCGPRSGL